MLRLPRNLAAVSLTVSVFVHLGCDGQRESTQEPEPDKAANQAAVAQSAPATVVHIPVGEFTLGSSPGDVGRKPALEHATTDLRLGPFRIDSHPYPGDGSPPRLGASQEEAAALCAKKEGRLCSEIEWERACRGPASSIYPTGKTGCQKDQACISGFDTALMTMIPEWTASRFGKDSEYAGEWVVRGAPSALSADHRRCARRDAIAAKKREGVDSSEVGFRCCYGAPNAASVSEPTLGVAYEELSMTQDELRQLLSEDTVTAPFAKSAKFFKPEAARTVLARGGGDDKGFTLTTSPVIWRPSAGSKFLVLAAHDDKKTSFVLAYFLGDTKKKLAGSFVMKNEPGPIALAYAQSIRPRIHFSGCFGCPGETGKVLFRDPEELVLLQP